MRIHPSTGLTLAAGLLLAVTLPSGPGMTKEPQVESQSWSFEGPFGSFDNDVIFARAGLLLALDRPLGFAFDRGKVATIHLQFGLHL